MKNLNEEIEKINNLSNYQLGVVINEQEPKEVVKDSRKNFSQMKNLEMYKGCTVQKINNTLRVNGPESTIDTGVFFDAKIS